MSQVKSWPLQDDHTDQFKAQRAAIHCELYFVLKPSDVSYRDTAKGAQQRYGAKLRKAQLVRQQGESQCTPVNAHRDRNTELVILRD